VSYVSIDGSNPEVYLGKDFDTSMRFRHRGHRVAAARRAVVVAWRLHALGGRW
jgi:hypothetical protein